jgi:hypothetical protein
VRPLGPARDREGYNIKKEKNPRIAGIKNVVDDDDDDDNDYNNNNNRIIFPGNLTP